MTSAIMVDSKILCNVPLEEAVPIFVASFYVFNIAYTEGCSNLFQGLEYIFFNTNPENKKVHSTVTRLLCI